MKQFFEQYGGVALGVLALLVLIAMITPVGNIIKTSLQGTVDKFSSSINGQVDQGLTDTAKAQNSALNVLGGSGGSNSSSSSSEVNFTIDGTSFIVDPGTTWESWADTNSAGYSINNERIAIEKDSRTYLVYDSIGVKYNEEIQAKSYSLVKMPVNGELILIDGKTYNVLSDNWSASGRRPVANLFSENKAYQMNLSDVNFTYTDVVVDNGGSSQTGNSGSGSSGSGNSGGSSSGSSTTQSTKTIAAGIYKFNDTITKPDGISPQCGLNFTSGGTTYNEIGFSSITWGGLKSYSIDFGDGATKIQIASDGSTNFLDSAYQTLILNTDSEVAETFYNWFIANTISQ